MATGLRVVCTRVPGHVVGNSSATSSLRGAVPFSTMPRRSVVLKVYNIDAPPKRESSFFIPESLIEKVKVRFGLKEQQATLSQGVDEEVEQELARELGKRKEDLETTATSVIRDDLSPEVFWEQGKKDINAEDNQRRNLTSPGFSFSAAGHLFPYHLGVCDCLIEHKYLTENTPLAGSSAGALVCAVVAGGLEMSDALRAAKEVAQDCRKNGTAFRLGAVLRGIMEKYLPEDAHTRVNGRIRVAVTQLFRQPRGMIVDQFDSREDLINALHTSCFIPGYFAPKPATIFRDRVCIDGGFTLFMPPTAAETTIRICAFFASAYNIKGVHISPDCNPSESRPTNQQQLLNLAFYPAEDEVLDEMFRAGYEDALCWVNRQSSVSENSEMVL
ncbi:unnamed protein product [Calypogeia fissa]